MIRAMQLEEFVSNSGPDLRGDYSHARADFTLDQDPASYAPGEHALWRRLYERQGKLLPGYAFDAYLESLAHLDAGDSIPDFEKVSRRLRQATGWEIVAVPGLIPDLAFFGHLARRRFPVTVWLRKPGEFDYIAEPDVFHDFIGHVPLLFDPAYADYMPTYERLRALPAFAPGEGRRGRPPGAGRDMSTIERAAG